MQNTQAGTHIDERKRMHTEYQAKPYCHSDSMKRQNLARIINMYDTQMQMESIDANDIRNNLVTFITDKLKRTKIHT